MAGTMMPQIVGDPDRELTADWDLFQAVECGSAAMRWRCWELEQPVVVIGRHGSIERELVLDACAADRVPVVQRVSGGGAVVIGRGCLNYAIAIPLENSPELADITQSYAVILKAIVTGLDVIGLMIDGGA